MMYCVKKDLEHADMLLSVAYEIIDRASKTESLTEQDRKDLDECATEIFANGDWIQGLAERLP